MSTTTRIGLFILILHVAACSAFGNSRQSSELGSLMASSITPKEANADRRVHDGEILQVFGYLQYSDVGFGLWTSKEAFERGDLSECITPIADERMGSLLRQNDGKIVGLVGKFTKSYNDEEIVVFGPCNFTGIRVVKIIAR